VVGPLLHERDMYLAWSLKRSKAVNGSGRVVGVVGKGHLRGVLYHLVTPGSSRNLRFRCANVLYWESATMACSRGITAWQGLAGVKEHPGVAPAVWPVKQVGLSTFSWGVPILNPLTPKLLNQSWVLFWGLSKSNASLMHFVFSLLSRDLVGGLRGMLR
jgi:hypothetical protein